MKNLIEQFKSKKGQIAVLIDPEKCKDTAQLSELIQKIEFAGVDYIFIGGSTVTKAEFDATMEIIAQKTKIPLVIFPGSSEQISSKADAILFLSLLSGRNPDFLIGHHVQAAKQLYDMNIEVLPTAYLLIDGGTKSSVAYISQTTPIPRDKHVIVRNTALAGKLQGKQVLFLDAGSGAAQSVPAQMVEMVSDLELPIIVGGGITSPHQLKELKRAGANILVIGNKLEEDLDFLLDLQHFISEQC